MGTRARGAILVTGDRRLATPLRGTRKFRCLFLPDLGTQELDRVRGLLATVEVEAEAMGERFWMQIGAEITSCDGVMLWCLILAIALLRRGSTASIVRARQSPAIP